MDFNDIKDFLFFFFANLGRQATGTLIAVAGSLLGVIAGSVISRRISNETIIRSHKNAIDIMQRQDFNKAAALFRDAFYPDLLFLKHNAIFAEKGSADNLSLFLNAGYFHRHLKAFETFKNYLSAEERANIDNAWQKYCRRPDDPNVLCFEQYSTKNISKEREKELKELALQKIEEILKFAKHK